jgi:hypothetical protein
MKYVVHDFSTLPFQIFYFLFFLSVLLIFFLLLSFFFLFFYFYCFVFSFCFVDFLSFFFSN